MVIEWTKLTKGKNKLNKQKKKEKKKKGTRGGCTSNRVRGILALKFRILKAKKKS